MGTLGFRPPRFSEDAAWLPAWLQQKQEDALAEDFNGPQTASEQGLKNLEFLRGNIGERKDMSLLSRENGRYSSFHLFLSGENSPASFAPSSGNVLHFHLHLTSSESNSENIGGPPFVISEAERLGANKPLSVISRNREETYQSNNDYNVGIVKLFPPKAISPQCQPIKKDRGGGHGYDKTCEIDDAVELSIAASEALTIHESIKTESSSPSKPPPAAAVLEVALRVKQARLEGGFEDYLHCQSTEEPDEIDFLSDLDESTMEDAFEDVGLQVCTSGLSRVEDTPVSQTHYGGHGNFFSVELQDKEVQIDNVAISKQSKEVLSMDEQSSLSLPSEFLGCPCPVDPPLHMPVQEYPDASANAKRADLATVDVTSFESQRHVNLSAQAWDSGNAEGENQVTNVISSKFSSRWLGGWTVKEVDDFTTKNAIKRIPGLFIGETSFLSESADGAADQNSFVQADLASECSIDFDGLCSLSSSVDPLCSVVPCSIDAAGCTPARNQIDKEITGNCFSLPLEVATTVNLQENPSSQDVGYFHGEGGAATMVNCEVSVTTIRRQLTSLKNYSMLLPHRPFLTEDYKKNREDSITGDQTAKDMAQLQNHQLEERTSALWASSKCCVNNKLTAAENLERLAVPVVAETVVRPRENNPESESNNRHDTQIPAKKRVRFSEAEDKVQQNKKLQNIQSTHRKRSYARVGKRLKSSNQQNRFRCKNAKRLIFQGIRFLLTGFTTEKEKEIQGMVRKYGGVVLSDIPSMPTSSRGKRSSRSNSKHLPVVLCLKKLQTTKFLYGCAVNSSILDVSWLIDSIAAGSVLPTEKYLILSNQADVMCTRIGKPIRHNYIFDGVGIMLQGKHDFSNKFAKILKHGGGQVFKTLQQLVQSVECGKIYKGAIVSEDDRTASRHLRHCASEQKIPVMPGSWIIESLHLGKLLPLALAEKRRTPPIPRIKIPVIPISLQLGEDIYNC